MENTTRIPSDFESLRDLVMQRSLAEKLALVKELEKETFASRFSDLLERIRSRSVGPTLTDEEIQAEIDAVRSQRYNS